MGKNKDGANRTKGNVKPSSSARSADLLNAHLGTNATLPGLNASLPVLGLGGVLGDESAEDALPNEIKQTMRKMSKKDATTKLKALQEFIEFVNENSQSDNDSEASSKDNAVGPDLESIKATLPFWPRLYCRLSNDNDRRVREYAHKAHLKLSTTVGRDLAPHLRSIAAAWFLGRFDCHPPAASAANEAFNAVFPSKSEGSSKKNKQREAIIFCGNEILSAIKENLINASPQIPGETKLSAEEQLSRYNRLIATSLNAYAAFWQDLAELQPISESDSEGSKHESWKQLNKAFEKTKEIQVSILNEGKFWKYSQSKEPAIRSALYSLLCTICKYCFEPNDTNAAESECPDDSKQVLILSQKHLEKVASASLGRLDDSSDAVLTSRIWDTTLYLVIKYKNWSSLIDVDKRVIPKIFAALEKPKYASVIYPSLLPLLSKLPLIQKLKTTSDNSIEVYEFFKRLFESFRKGAEKELGFQGQSALNKDSSCPSIRPYGVDMKALKSCVKTYFDCTLYYSQVTRRNSKEEEKESINENVIFQQVIQWIDEITMLQVDEVSSMGSPESPTEDRNDKKRNLYSRDLIHETVMIEGYGRFINALDKRCLNTEGKEEPGDLMLSAQSLFWDHLTNMCTKLHQLSVLDQRALKCLQVLLSALYDNPNEEINISSTKNRPRKLRFADNAPKESVVEEAAKSTNCKTRRSMNPEFEKIINELALDSLLGVLKASSETDINGQIVNHYSDQLKFITGLLAQQNQTSSNVNDLSTFYEDLWKGVNDSVNGSSDVAVDNVAGLGKEHQAVCDILNTLVINLPNNRYLKDKSVQLQYVDLYLTIIEALPLKNRAEYLSAEFEKLYQNEKSGILAKSDISSLDWMILVMAQIVDPCSRKRGLINLQEMMQSCNESSKKFSFIVEDLSSILFVGDSNNSLGKEKCVKLLKLVIKHLGSVILQDCVDRILNSLLTKCTSVVNHYKCEMSNQSGSINIALTQDLTNAIIILEELARQRPTFWTVDSKESKRTELLISIFKLSTFDMLKLDGTINKILDSSWELGLLYSIKSLGIDSDKNKQYTQIEDELCQFIRKRLSDFNLRADDGKLMDTNFNSSIDSLATQAWKFLQLYQGVSDEDNETSGIADWRKILHEILPKNKNELTEVKDNNSFASRRIGITALPDISFLHGSESRKHGKDSTLRIDMNYTVCRFLLKIYSNMSIGDVHVAGDSTAEDITYDFIEAIAFIESGLRDDTNNSKNANVLFKSANSILNEDGAITLYLLNKSLELSIKHGWEYSLCLERSLRYIEDTPSVLNQSEHTTAYEVAESFAKKIGILPDIRESVANKDIVENATEGRIHTTIVLLKFLNRSQISSILMTEIGRILSLDPAGENNEESCDINHAELKQRIGSSFFLVNACLKRKSYIADFAQEMLYEDEKIAVKALLQLIWNWRQKFEQDFLFSCNIFDDMDVESDRISEVNNDIVFVVSIIEFLELSIRPLFVKWPDTDNDNGIRIPIMDLVTTQAGKDVCTEQSKYALEASHWDLILCALSSWTQSMEESNFLAVFKTDEKANTKESKVVSLDTKKKRILARNFGSAVSKLTVTVSEWISCLTQSKGSATATSSTENKDQSSGVLEEWQNFFAEGIYSVILNTFVAIATYFQNSSKTKGNKIIGANSKTIMSQLLASLGQALKTIPDEQLIETHGLPAKFNTQDVITCSPDQMALPDKIVFLLNHLSPLLISSERSIQVTSYHLLSRTMVKIAEHETQRHTKEIENPTATPDNTTSQDDAEEYKEIPKRLAEILEKMENVLNILFKEFELSFGEQLPVPFPLGSAAYNSTLTYLLAWRLIIALIENVSGDDLRPKYSEFLRRGRHMDTVMMVLFHTMISPVEKDQQHIPNIYNSTDIDRKNDWYFREYHDLFWDNGNKLNHSIINKFDLPSLSCQSYEINDTSLEIQALARNIYYDMLKYLPALVRNWWNLSDKRAANVVEKFTSSKVAPSLWSEEVERINSVKENTFDNMTIKVRSSVREVVAIYTLGDDGSEGSMELVIQLPANFPLGAVQVESGKRVGVTTSLLP